MKTSEKKRASIKEMLKHNYTKYYELYMKTGKKEYRTKFRDIKVTLDDLFKEDLVRWNNYIL